MPENSTVQILRLISALAKDDTQEAARLLDVMTTNELSRLGQELAVCATIPAAIRALRHGHIQQAAIEFNAAADEIAAQDEGTQDQWADQSKVVTTVEIPEEVDVVMSLFAVPNPSGGESLITAVRCETDFEPNPEFGPSFDLDPGLSPWLDSNSAADFEQEHDESQEDQSEI